MRNHKTTAFSRFMFLKEKQLNVRKTNCWMLSKILLVINILVLNGQNNGSMHRMDVLWSLMQLLQPKTSAWSRIEYPLLACSCCVTTTIVLNMTLCVCVCVVSFSLLLLRVRVNISIFLLRSFGFVVTLSYLFMVCNIRNNHNLQHKWSHSLLSTLQL